ncbi:unnamed protein product [Linum tenue]|uniref:Uncharacterized protein n=1 Tax=Linum tenue TaxID=586396 RepID=A0AAV0LGD1_9ROSI|nr:unnamed protein product [Linum tenue]
MDQSVAIVQFTTKANGLGCLMSSFKKIDSCQVEY